jgi:hypothetical protein
MAVAHTWFWTRSLIRSMGAAAVFETAAETPPTVGACQQCIRCWIQLRRRAIDEYPIRARPIDTAGKCARIHILRKSTTKDCREVVSEMLMWLIDCRLEISKSRRPTELAPSSVDSPTVAETIDSRNRGQLEPAIEMARRARVKPDDPRWSERFSTADCDNVPACP